MIEEYIVLGQVYIGKQGEHHVRMVRIPEYTTWKYVYGEGTFELLHKRSGDTEPYSVDIETINGCGYWKIAMKDTVYSGEGQCELRYTVDGVVVKSQFATTIVVAISDIDTDETPGGSSGSSDSISEMLAIKAEVLEAKEEVEKLCENLPEEVVVDTSLSKTSSNPIANKAVAQKFAEIEENSENVSSTDENGNFAVNDNIVNCKAYYIESIDLENKKIYLSKTKVLPVISTEDNTDTNFASPAYSVGDVFSIINKNHYNSCGTITSVWYNVVSYAEDSLGFSSIIEDTDESIADYTFRVYNKPEEGVVLITEDAFAVGENNKALGTCSSAEGYGNVADGFFAHVEGRDNYAAYAAHAEGNGCAAVGNESHAEGHKTKASGGNAHAEGQNTIASGGGSHAEGMQTTAIGSQSHAEGKSTIAKGAQSHAEGVGTQANAFCSHVEGNGSIASGSQAHAEGYQTIASGQSSHSEGQQTEASGTFAHAQGIRSYAKGYAAFSSGADVEASGDVTVAIGKTAKALGRASMAVGESVTANKSQSVAMGMGTTSDAQAQMVVGMYNEADADAMFIVGNGTASKRNNAFVVKRDGRIFANGTELGLGGSFKKIGFTSDCDYVATSSDGLTAFNNAISNASDGDTILVMPGTYIGGSTGVVDKNLNFIGIGKPAINFKLQIGNYSSAEIVSTWDNFDFIGVIECTPTSDYSSSAWNVKNSIFRANSTISKLFGTMTDCEFVNRNLGSSLYYTGDDSQNFVLYRDCKFYNCTIIGDVCSFTGCVIHDGTIPDGYSVGYTDCELYNYGGTMVGAYNFTCNRCTFYGKAPTMYDYNNNSLTDCYLIEGTRMAL